MNQDGSGGDRRRVPHCPLVASPRHQVYSKRMKARTPVPVSAAQLRTELEWIIRTMVALKRDHELLRKGLSSGHPVLTDADFAEEWWKDAPEGSIVRDVLARAAQR